MPRVRFRALPVAFSAAMLLIGTCAASAASAAPTPAGPRSAPSRPAGQATLPAAPAGQSRWIGTWEGASSGSSGLVCSDCTFRNIVHTGIGGRDVRIRLSNVFGQAPLVVAHATVALPADPGTADVLPGTLREVTFGGSASVTIPVGQDVWSDPVSLAVPADHDLLVSTYTPGFPTHFTFHPSAQQNSFWTSGADQTDSTSASAFPNTTSSWYIVTGVDVNGTQAQGSVVAFGDSITDGFQSAYGRNARWPNILADRLGALPARDQLGVLNAGIGGNRILLDGGDGYGPSGLSRFNRDVLQQSGVRAVIILEGINDIQLDPKQLDAQKIIAGLQQLIDTAHAHGLRVIGATLTPFVGSGASQQEEQTREAVNDWIRTSHAYDAVIDFDTVIRDPADPLRMRPAYDSGDHLHPNNPGYMAMGAAVSLADLGINVPADRAGPVMRSVAPHPASAGQTVTISGSGFGATQGDGYVAFTDTGTYWGGPLDQAYLPIDSWSDGAITFTVPQPSGPGGAWRVNAGTTATVNVITSAGAVSQTTPLDITPTANLADYYDNTGISPDTNQGCANLDGDGYSFSGQTLTAAGLSPGATITAGGLTYTWPAQACSPDNILADAQTILVDGSAGATTLGLLGTSTNGSAQGTVLINYSDGTTSAATVTFGDWASAAVSGDTAVATLPYRNSQSGTSNQLTVYLFATQIPVNAAKTVVSVTLPDLGNSVASVTAMHIFAVALGS